MCADKCDPTVWQFNRFWSRPYRFQPCSLPGNIPILALRLHQSLRIARLSSSFLDSSQSRLPSLCCEYPVLSYSTPSAITDCTSRVFLPDSPMQCKFLKEEDKLLAIERYGDLPKPSYPILTLLSQTPHEPTRCRKPRVEMGPCKGGLPGP